MLLLLAKFECDGWFNFFKNKELSKKKKKKKKGFPLKLDDIIVISSNVHEWEGKPSKGPLYDVNVDATDHSKQSYTQ